MNAPTQSATSPSTDVISVLAPAETSGNSYHNHCIVPGHSHWDGNPCGESCDLLLNQQNRPWAGAQ